MNTFIISSTIACIDSNMVKNAQYGNYTDPLRCYDIDSYRYKTIIETTIVVLNDHALFFVKYNDQKNDLHEPCVEVNMISCSMMVLGGSDIQSQCNILGWLLGFITKFFSSDFLYRQQQMQADEGQGALFRSRDEWIDTLPKAWGSHVLLEKETQLKE